MNTPPFKGRGVYAPQKVGIMYELIETALLMGAGAVVLRAWLSFDDNGPSLGLVGLLLTSVVLGGVSGYFDTLAQDQAQDRHQADQRAAAKQGIAIVTFDDESPRTAEPCEIKLDRTGSGDMTVLVIKGTDKKATKDLVAQLC